MTSATTERPADLIDASTAAKRLRVHISTIFRWIQSGKIQGWKRRPRGSAKSRYFVSKSVVDDCWAPTDPAKPVGFGADSLPETGAAEKVRLDSVRAKLFGRKPT